MGAVAGRDGRQVQRRVQRQVQRRVQRCTKTLNHLRHASFLSQTVWYYTTSSVYTDASAS